MFRQPLRITLLLVAMPAWSQVQQVEIVATSPLPGQGIARDLLPYMTQVLRRGTIDAAQADTTTDLLARRAAGVQTSDIQGSPYQAELSFRGHRASGLPGAPQGLSVYLDGVRINEPFGDVVSWDLVPEFALDSVALVPGANPAFGLNTLGGAIAMTTLDGRRAPGLRAEASAASFGRRRLDLAHGDVDGDVDHFVGFGLFEETGWREHSAGRLGTLLAKLGVQTDAGRWGLSVLAGHSRLVGNGLVPWVTLDDDGERTPDMAWFDRRAVYTHPDRTTQQMTQLGATWQWAVSGGAAMEALVYARHTRRDTLNGDLAEAPAEAANASINRAHARQSAVGASLGWSARTGGHQWQLGVSVDQARMRYLQAGQAGRFTATRGVVPIDGEGPTPDVTVQGRHLGWGLHASDTLRVAEATHVTGTLRFNEARPANRLTRLDEDEGAAANAPEERFRYRNWNPAIGIAHRVDDAFTLFANAARNHRAPTVIELGCADADQACRLPAGLQSDPYLKPVRSATIEGGLRFGHDSEDGGSLTLYRNDNHDDIVFASVGAGGHLGYFRNVPLTRYQGLDSEGHGRTGAWSWSAGYSLLDASYRFAGVLRQGERNVQIRPGTRMAGMSRHQLRLALDWQGGALSLGTDLQASSRRRVAGNEDGRIADDSTDRVDLSLPGQALLNLRARWRPAAGWEWFARVGNTLDQHGASHGALAETMFDAQGRFSGHGRDALFMAPTTPRSLSFGLRLAL